MLQVVGVEEGVEEIMVSEMTAADLEAEMSTEQVVRVQVEAVFHEVR